MKHFLSTQHAAEEAGMSMRHFHRLAAQYGIKPLVFRHDKVSMGAQKKPHCLWTPDMVAQIKKLRGACA